MKAIKLIAVFFILVQFGCVKEKDNPTISLYNKWKVYNTVIVKMDDMKEQGACAYKTKVSDLYWPPILTRCDADDIYEFNQSNKLTIYSGDKKCAMDEPNKLTISFDQKGDSIITDKFRYNVVLLSRDTLILDYCVDNTVYPPGTTVINRGKLGVKFVRVK